MSSPLDVVSSRYFCQNCRRRLQDQATPNTSARIFGRRLRAALEQPTCNPPATIQLPRFVARKKQRLALRPSTICLWSVLRELCPPLQKSMPEEAAATVEVSTLIMIFPPAESLHQTRTVFAFAENHELPKGHSLTLESPHQFGAHHPLLNSGGNMKARSDRFDSGIVLCRRGCVLRRRPHFWAPGS